MNDLPYSMGLRYIPFERGYRRRFGGQIKTKRWQFVFEMEILE